MAATPLLLLRIFLVVMLQTCIVRLEFSATTKSNSSEDRVGRRAQSTQLTPSTNTTQLTPSTNTTHVNKILDDSVYYDPDENATIADNDIVLALNLHWEKRENTSEARLDKGEYYAGAAAVAIQDINNDPNILPNHRLRLYWKLNETRTMCDRDRAIKNLLKQLQIKTIHGFLGFTCHCRAVASIASAINLPLYSMGCKEMDLSDKKNYQTLIRTKTLNSDVVQMILQFMTMYSWKKVAVIYDLEHKWEVVFDALQKDNKNSINITLHQSCNTTINRRRYYKNCFDAFLDELPKNARIVLVMLDIYDLQQFMLRASERGYTQKEYVFVAIHPFAMDRHEYMLRRYMAIDIWVDVDLGKKDKDEPVKFGTLDVIEKAFKGLFVLVPQTPSFFGEEYNRYDTFQRQVREVMIQKPFNKTQFKLTTLIPLKGYQLYDAVKLYALGVNKTIQQGHSITDGRAVIENMHDTEHRSICGSPFIVNCDADVQQLFEVVQFQFKNKSHDYYLPTPVLTFKKTNKQVCMDPLFELHKLKDNQPQWKSGKPPKDEPDCGFVCPEETSIQKELIGVGVGIGFLVLILFLKQTYRNHRLKIDLKEQPWKIQASELEYHELTASTSSLGSLPSLCGSSHSLQSGYQQDISTAIYKGGLVAVKKIRQRTVELNKSVLVELKQVCDVRNENLNPFIGACVEPNNILLVTQLATRGSLKGVLENSDMHLDTSFILSLVYDITKGMTYLHSTDIKFHGNLKSSNCVIDSRWVLKIDDFGLNNFRRARGSISSMNSEQCEDLLWKAPELLRDHHNAKMSRADVYSFAIILQECHTRNGPWSLGDESAEEVINKVRAPLTPPYRPIVPNQIEDAEGLYEIMKKCWQENPDDRPHFWEVKKEVEGMMKKIGMRANMVDNMLAMLEKHSNNLEELVVQRTDSLSLEKQKVEALLERMLPKMIARQLKDGNQVEPVSFEEVTIYFSDIVGFTNICATIEPIDVVTLLNTLYTMFDNIASDYDVYKVETIGDAYMVVSGLPIRNKKQHVKEISLMALDILKNMKSFKIRPKNQQLLIRIGVHSGSVVAGVVGTTMPRYCLFGDTVNVAARMETNGEASRIHMSSEAHELLSKFEGFRTEFRGKIPVKGRGEMETFWLTGVDTKLMHDRSMRNRDQASLYELNRNSPSFSRLLRESPRITRRSVKVTKKTIGESETTHVSKGQRIMRYFRKPLVDMFCNKLSCNCDSHNSHVDTEMSELTSNERRSLMPSNATLITLDASRPADRNGNELSVAL